MSFFDFVKNVFPEHFCKIKQLNVKFSTRKHNLAIEETNYGVNLCQNWKSFLNGILNVLSQCCSAAEDTYTGDKVAIKKLSRPFQSKVHAKRSYRELKLLRHMEHENVLDLLDVFTPDSGIDTITDV